MMLRRLLFRELPPIEVFAARAAAGRAERAEAMIAAAQAQLDELHRPPARTPSRARPAGAGARASVRS